MINRNEENPIFYEPKSVTDLTHTESKEDLDYEAKKFELNKKKLGLKMSLIITVGGVLGAVYTFKYYPEHISAAYVFLGVVAGGWFSSMGSSIISFNKPH